MNISFITVVVSIVAFSFACISVQGQGNETSCSTEGNSTKCMFNPSQLKLPEGSESAIQFLNTNGKTVKCNAMATSNGWYGEVCNSNARDANFIQRKDPNGINQVFGSIRIGTDICHVKPNANGAEEMTCTPEADFPRAGDAVEPPAGRNMEDYDAHVRHLQVGFDPTHPIGGATDVHGRMLYDDSGSNIDFLVVWTSDAECGNSGFSPGCTLTATTESNMRGLIDLAVEETNTAYSLSGMLSSLRLVHAYRDTTYVEPSTFREALDNLSEVSDGELDNVHAMRSLYGADMVQLIVANFEYCGLAWIASSRNFAFGVVNYFCATGFYVYGHEIGHNFGMNHDRGTKNSCTQPGYNYGYRSPTAAFRSIMAYDCAIGQCDNMPKDGCTTAQRFSNTQFLYDGQAIGNTNNNNALQFNNLRAKVASHFPAMNCQSNAQCNDKNANTIDTCNVAKAVCVFTPGGGPTSPPNSPSTSPTNCGLLGLGVFCPFTLCGLLGRLLGLCSN